MDSLKKLIDFLDKLEVHKLFYHLSKLRDSILVEIAVPGQRWEVEFMYDGTIEVEKFLTTINILGEEAIDELFRDFSD